MYYVTTSNGWLDGAGWQYTNEVLESGKANSIDDIDLKGWLIEMFKDGFEPNYKGGYDVCYRAKLYNSKDAFENNEKPIDEQEVWEKEQWEEYCKA